MGFTVRDFNDLMRLLDRHPEWVEALRQRLLTRELLDSPKTLRRLSRRVGRVERAVEDLKATVQDLAQSVQALTESVAALIQAQQQRDEAFAAFRAEVDRRFAELAEAQRRHYEEVRLPTARSSSNTGPKPTAASPNSPRSSAATTKSSPPTGPKPTAGSPSWPRPSRLSPSGWTT
jgi:septal ring factor EnvC (AmiA/AmiB activator)